jgi:hypothetical protein
VIHLDFAKYLKKNLSAASFGEKDDKCADALLLYGRCLLELGRAENCVLGNALKGWSGIEYDSQENLESEQFEDPSKMSEDERVKLRVEVTDAMAEADTEDDEVGDKDVVEAKMEVTSEVKSEDAKMEVTSEVKPDEAKMEVTAKVNDEEAKADELKPEEAKIDAKSAEAKTEQKMEATPAEEPMSVDTTETPKSEEKTVSFLKVIKNVSSKTSIA